MAGGLTKNHGQARERERAETRRNSDDAAGVHFPLLLTTERFQKQWSWFLLDFLFSISDQPHVRSLLFTVDVFFFSILVF